METHTEDSRIGTILNNRYRITERIAAGGMGVVYRGERLELGRPVAIKFLHETFTAQKTFLKRFEREAKAMSQLSHPYCVSVIDFGVEGAPYIVMDYVTGRTLKTLLFDQRLSIDRVMRIVDQLLAAIGHAHSNGIVHRDIKPGNIMLCEATGVGEHVCIFDFGLAKLVGSLGETHSEATMVVGTPSYMSPEQAQGGTADERSDLYSTAVVLFELLSGQKPFDDENGINVLKMHIATPPPSLLEVDPNTPFSQELEQVVRKALSKNPDNRYQKADKFARALRATPEATAIGDPTGAVVPQIGAFDTIALEDEDLIEAGEHTRAGQQSLARRRRKSNWLRGIALILVIVAAVLVWVWAQNRPWEQYLQPKKTAAQPASTPKLKKPPSEPPPEVVRAPVKQPPPSEPTVPEKEVESPAQGVVESPPSADTGAPVDLPVPAEEPVVETPPPAKPEPREKAKPRATARSGPVEDIDDVRALLNAGKKKEAIDGLLYLRKIRPNSAFVHFLLGNLYFEKRWWGNAMDLYRDAIKLKKSYRYRPAINRNLIEALQGGKSSRKARSIILKDIGKPALPFLRKAARNHPKAVVRKRAKALIKKLSR